MKTTVITRGNPVDHLSTFRRSSRAWQPASAVAVAALLLIITTGCPNRDDGTKPQPDVAESGPVTRLRIVPGALLLPGFGATAKLAIEAFNAEGRAVGSPAVTWRSSDSASVVVDPDGTATAFASSGTAQIVAEVDGVVSAPIFVAVGTPIAGASVIADEQTVGDPAPEDASAPYGLGYRYRVTLTGVPAPTVGSILIGTGEKPIGGRVLEVVTSGDQIDVLLELVGLNEMFDQLKITHHVDLSQAEFDIDPAIEERYSVTREADGSFKFAPKPDATKLRVRSQAQGTRALGPFECEFEGNPLIQLSSEPIYSINSSLTVDWDYDSDFGGLQKLVLKGALTADFNFSPMLEVGFGGAIECQKELLQLRLPPPPGPLALFISGFVPISVGVGLEGSLTLQTGFEMSQNASAKAKVGVARGADGTLGLVHSLEAETGEPVFRPVWPNLNNLAENAKIQLGAELFASAELSIGNPFLRALRFDALEFKAGPKFELSLEHPKAQIKKGKRSKFELVFAGEIGTGSSFSIIEDLFKFDFVESKFKLEIPLDEAPSGTFEITPTAVRAGHENNPGESATFITQLNKATFLTLQAVEKIEYYRLQNGDLQALPSESANDVVIPCTDVPATLGQTTFSCEARFTEEQAGRQTFYAFVRARLFGIPLPFPIAVKDEPEARLTVEAERLAEFTGLGFLPGATAPHSVASAVSADGSVVVGRSTNAQRNEEAFRWSGGTMTGLGFLPGASNLSSEALAVSGDGSVVVGFSRASHGRFEVNEAFRWSDGTMTGLGFLGDEGSQSSASGVSGDGSVVVGTSTRPGVAFRWTRGKMTSLGSLGAKIPNSGAADVNGDGSVVVGQSSNVQGIQEAFRWSGGTMTGLGGLPGGFVHSSALGVSGDGIVVVGGAHDNNHFGEAFHWSGGTMTGLGFLPGATSFFSLANAVNGDGSVVVGTSVNAQGILEAFIWDAQFGMRSLKNELMNEYGLTGDIVNWSLSDARAISPDGKTIVGSGENPQGQTEAWRAVLGRRRN